MRLLMIAVVAILLIGGGGSGAYYYFKHPAEAATSALAEHGKAAQETRKEIDKDASFVQLDPLILPVIGKDGVTQTVSMVVVIETPTEETKKEVTHLEPKLKDAFIQDMYGALTQANVMKNGVIQVAPIKARLYKIGTRVLGKEAVSDVLLQVVQQRPM